MIGASQAVTLGILNVHKYRQAEILPFAHFYRPEHAIRAAWIAILRAISIERHNRMQ